MVMKKYLIGGVALVALLLLFKAQSLFSGFLSSKPVQQKIKDMTKEMLPQFSAVSVSITKSKIRPISEIKAIASRLWLLLAPAQRSKSSEILSLLSGLNTDELKALYVEFGIKEIPEIKLGFGFENRTGDLIEVLKAELIDFNPLDWNGLSKVKDFFKNTGLWK
jgi:hypothetical protein